MNFVAGIKIQENPFFLTEHELFLIQSHYYYAMSAEDSKIQVQC